MLAPVSGFLVWCESATLRFVVSRVMSRSDIVKGGTAKLGLAPGHLA